MNDSWNYDKPTCEVWDYDEAVRTYSGDGAPYVYYVRYYVRKRIKSLPHHRKSAAEETMKEFLANGICAWVEEIK